MKQINLYASVTFLALVAPASAKDISITLNDEEQKALVQILDTATKAGGLQVAQATVWFAKKLDDAAKAVPQPPPKPPE
jgi:hypothetical protein